MGLGRWQPPLVLQPPLRKPLAQALRQPKRRRCPPLFCVARRLGRYRLRLGHVSGLNRCGGGFCGGRAHGRCLARFGGLGRRRSLGRGGRAGRWGLGCRYRRRRRCHAAGGEHLACWRSRAVPRQGHALQHQPVNGQHQGGQDPQGAPWHQRALTVQQAWWQAQRLMRCLRPDRWKAGRPQPVGALRWHHPIPGRTRPPSPAW